MAEHVHPGPGQISLVQRVCQGGFIYKRTSGSVDQKRCGLHQRKQVLSNDTLVWGVKGQ